MRYIRATFSDGTEIITAINGTDQEIRDYYCGQYFQFGDTDDCPGDKLLECTQLEFLT